MQPPKLLPKKRQPNNDPIRPADLRNTTRTEDLTSQNNEGIRKGTFSFILPEP